MAYEVVFPGERVERAFQKSLTKIPAKYKDAIVTAIRLLTANPRPEGKRTKKFAGKLIVCYSPPSIGFASVPIACCTTSTTNPRK